MNKELFSCSYAELKSRKGCEVHVFEYDQLEHPLIWVSLFFTEGGRHLVRPWTVKFFCVGPREYRYKTLKEARKAYKNLVAKYPDRRN